MHTSSSRGQLVTGGVVAGVAMALLFSAACGEKKKAGDKTGSNPASGSAPGTGSPGNGSAPGTGTPPGPGTGTTAPKPAKKLEAAAVQAVIDGWLKAQNDGAFAEYEKLYATRMTGIKRVGLRTFRFDRKGWLKDRERMFKSKMTVGAADPKIELGSTTATVHFTQTFSQGKFKDEGPKEMLIALEGDTLKIAREEMLSSRVGSSQTSAKMADVLLVVEVADTQYAVVATGAEAAWGTGALGKPIEDGGLYAVTQATGPGLPKAQAAWNGRAIAVYDKAGTACKTTVGALKLLSAVTPHFGTVQYWTDGDGEGSPPATDEDIASEVFSEDNLLLVAELGACKGVVAVPDTAKPLFLTPKAADAAMEKKAQDAFDALPAAKELQADFKTYGESGDWYDAPQITTFDKGDTHYVVVVAQGGEGCGDWQGQLSAVFFVDGKGVLTPQENTDGLFVTPSAMADLDGNGTIEVIGTTSSYGPEWTIIGTDEGMLDTMKTAEFRYSDCPC
jgi:hypothetical protein